MEFQKQTIREKLIENGWKIAELEKVELGWWASEMWLLESTWSPVGKMAFVTFLPEPENMEYVWEIMASGKKPDNRFGDQNSFTLSLKRWEKELPEFMGFLSDLRNQPN
ncbi:MAG TPA: hypothetical protein VK892_17145 [Pyrinomonadaceae bacterium]|nr:hypothetical protein [Pyrinomonadaceae bacterium]